MGISMNKRHPFWSAQGAAAQDMQNYLHAALWGLGWTSYILRHLELSLYDPLTHANFLLQLRMSKTDIM